MEVERHRTVTAGFFVFGMYEEIGSPPETGEIEDSPSSEALDEHTAESPSDDAKLQGGEGESAQSSAPEPKIEAPKTVPLPAHLERISRAKEQVRRARAEAESVRAELERYRSAATLLQRELQEERAARAGAIEYDPRDAHIRDMQLRQEWEASTRAAEAAKASRLAEIDAEVSQETEMAKLQVEFDSALGRYGDLVSYEDLRGEMLRLAQTGQEVPHASLVAGRLHQSRLNAALKRAGVKVPPQQQPKKPQQAKAPPVSGAARSARLTYSLDAGGFAQRMAELEASIGGKRR